MPDLANITIKKNDDTTDIVYTGVVPSAGDKTPAIWKSNSVGAAAAFRPELRLSSRSNGTNSARRLDAAFSYPVTTTGTDGVTRVTDRVNFTVSAVIPLGVPDTEIAEAVSQHMNLLDSALIKDSFKTGYSPT